MERLHQEVLRKERVFIRDNLEDVHAVNDYLLSCNIMTMNQKLDIEECDRSLRRKQKLLDFIETRGEQAFDVLMTAFRQEGYKHIYDKLTQTLNESQIQNRGDLRVVDSGGDQQEIVAQSSVVVENVETAAKQIDDWMYDELPGNERQRMITETELMLVAKLVSAKTKLETVGVKMGFTDVLMQHFQSCSPFYTPVQFNQMFSEWRKREGLGATVEAFITILRQASVDDDCCKHVFYQSSSDITHTKQIY